MPLKDQSEFINFLMEQNKTALAHNEKLIAQNEELIAQNEELTKTVSELTEKIEELTKKISELTEQKNENSNNSFRQPSSIYEFLDIRIVLYDLTGTPLSLSEKYNNINFYSKILRQFLA